MGCVWTTFQLKTISKKIVAYVTQVSWSVSLNVTLSLSSIVQFSLCALLPHRANWTEEGGQHKNNRDQTRDQEKERNARKKENSSAHEYLPASHCYVHDHFFVIQRFWSAEDHDTPCLTLGCFMNYTDVICKQTMNFFFKTLYDCLQNN